MGMAGRRIPWSAEEDRWIMENIEMDVESQYEQYVRIFGDAHSMSAFKTRRARINNQGRKHRRFTAAEDEWIIENYPHLGIEHGYPAFCEIFGSHHPRYAFITRAQDLGVKVTAERWRKACMNNGQHDNAPVGTIAKRGRGQNWIKTGKGTEGWMPLAQYLLGDNQNKIIIHLDGNKANDDLSNLRVISKAVCARMSKNKFWSSNPIITETGVLCCELQQLLCEGDV